MIENTTNHETNSTRTKAAAKNATKQTTLVLSPYLPSTKVKKMLKPWQAPLNKAPSMKYIQQEQKLQQTILLSKQL
jgi:tRNA A22 N-methylase